MAKTKTTKKGKTNVKKKSITKKATYNFKQASPLRKLGIVSFAALFALVAVIVLKASFAASPLKPFVDDPARGWVWKGLRKPGPNSKCQGLYEVIPKTSRDPVSCTHGPDPAPDGVDVRKPRSTSELVADTITGTADTSSAGSVSCVDDGVAGNRVQAVYLIASDQTDRYNSVVGLIKTWAGEMDKAVNDSAAKTGGTRHIRWVTDTPCDLNVAHVVVSPSGDDDFSSIKSAMNAAGYNHTDRKYVIWVDHTFLYNGNPACGISNLNLDKKPTQDNHNNGGYSDVLYGAIAVGCWGRSDHLSELHELTHLMGAVNPAAPHGTNYGHCTDEYDEMCYNDGGLKTGTTMTYPCASSQEWLMDCNNDDYFNTSPPAGSYLATYWNLVNSSFLTSAGAASSGSGGSSGGGGTTTTADTTSPVPKISNPANGSSFSKGSRVTISTSATDNVLVTKMEIIVDGTLRASTTGSSVNFTWNTRKTNIGVHIIQVNAYDAAGNVASVAVSVTIF